jgi:hypothetical protein
MTYVRPKIKAIKVQITRFIRDDNPGFVECKFYDAWNKEHSVHDKVPVVSLEDLDINSIYPREGIVGCEIIREWKDDEGRIILTVSSDKPWAIDTIEGLTEFDLLAHQVIEVQL